MKSFLKVARGELILGRWPFALALLFSLLPLGAGPGGAQEGSTLRQVVLVALFLAAAIAIVRVPERLRMVRQGLPLSLFVLLLYVGLSVVWSPEPWVSLKRWIQLVGVAVLGVGLLVGGSGTTRLHRVVTPVLLLALLLAISFSAVFPDFAFAENGFRAFMPTKNNFAQFAALCLLFPLVHVALGARHRVLWFGMAACALGALVLSRSATTGLAVAGMATIYAVAWALLRVHKSWWPPLLGLALVTLASAFAAGVLVGFPSAVAVLEVFLAPTGRDITLAGRTYLWELMVAEALHHPWFGLGYGGFWLGMEGASGQVAYLVKWGYPGQAHNGYLDVFNELGVVGCLLVLAFLVEHGRNVVRLLRTDLRLGLFHAAVLGTVVLLNVAEAVILRTTHMWWIVLVASSIECAYLTRASRPIGARTATLSGPMRVAS